MNSKIKTKEELKEIIKKLKEENKKIVFCNGCFDILHLGHIKFLEEAKQQGDILIVGLNSDSSVKEWKKQQEKKDWNKRPINSELERAKILSKLGMINYIIIYDDLTPISLIEFIKPDIHVNGSDYGEDCIEAEAVKKHGGKIHVVKLIDNYSTTNLIKKIKNS